MIKPHLERGKKVSLKEKKAYANGYSQAYQDCYNNVVSTEERFRLSLLVGSVALRQLLNPKSL